MITLLVDCISQMDSLISNLSSCNSEYHQRQGDHLYRQRLLPIPDLRSMVSMKAELMAAVMVDEMADVRE